MALKILLCYGLVITLTYGAPSKNIETVQVTDLATDLENWMAQLPDAIRKIPVNNLAIPGSHDSFTVDISSNSDVSPDGEDILKELAYLSIVKIVMANWSKTQGYHILEQLEAGIRFFDLRLCRNDQDGDLYFCHGMYSTEVKSVLTDLVPYLDSHPKEVVILDCQHFYDFTSDTHSEFIQLLGSTFGTKLIPYQSSMDSLTLENLASLNQQVLVIYRDGAQSGQSSLWPSENFPTPWYNTMDTDNLINDLNTGLSNRSSSPGYISQLILTPSVVDIIANVLSSLKQKCGVDFQDKRTQWISDQSPGPQGVNIIIGDFIDLSDNTFSKTVINLNQKLVASQFGILGKLKSFFYGLKGHFF